jgi:hypothetical protein
MQRKKDPQSAKGDEILRQMREDTSSKQHLDRQKIRAEIAIRKQWKRETRQYSCPFWPILESDPKLKQEEHIWRDFDDCRRNASADVIQTAPLLQ